MLFFIFTRSLFRTSLRIYMLIKHTHTDRHFRKCITKGLLPLRYGTMNFFLFCFCLKSILVRILYRLPSSLICFFFFVLFLFLFFLLFCSLSLSYLKSWFEKKTRTNILSQTIRLIYFHTHKRQQTEQKITHTPFFFFLIILFLTNLSFFFLSSSLCFHFFFFCSFFLGWRMFI